MSLWIRNAAIATMDRENPAAEANSAGNRGR